MKWLHTAACGVERMDDGCGEAIVGVAACRPRCAAHVASKVGGSSSSGSGDVLSTTPARRGGRPSNVTSPRESASMPASAAAARAPRPPDEAIPSRRADGAVKRTTGYSAVNPTDRGNATGTMHRPESAAPSPVHYIPRRGALEWDTCSPPDSCPFGNHRLPFHYNDDFLIRMLYKDSYYSDSY